MQSMEPCTSPSPSSHLQESLSKGATQSMDQHEQSSCQATHASQRWPYVSENGLSSIDVLIRSSTTCLPIFCLFSAKSRMFVAVEWRSFDLLPIKQIWFGFLCIVLFCFVKWSSRKDLSSTGLIIPFNPAYTVMCPKHEYGFNTIITTAFFIMIFSLHSCLGSALRNALEVLQLALILQEHCRHWGLNSELIFTCCSLHRRHCCQSRKNCIYWATYQQALTFTMPIISYLTQQNLFSRGRKCQK